MHIRETVALKWRGMVSCTLQPFTSGRKSPLCSQDGRLNQVQGHSVRGDNEEPPAPLVPTDNHALITKHELVNFADRFICY
jgi:hypothetical protein